MEYDAIKDNDLYGDYLSFSRRWLSALYRVTHDNGRLCLNLPLDTNKGGSRAVYSDVLQVAIESGWKYRTTIIWNEGNVSRRTAWGSWRSASAPYITAPVETVIVLYSGQWKKGYKGESDISRDDFIKWTNGLWTFNGENPRRVKHPAPFPVELPRRCIRLFSYTGDTIYDPFLGSGTTLIAGLECGRLVIGSDLSEGYTRIARARARQEFPDAAELAGVLPIIKPMQEPGRA